MSHRPIRFSTPQQQQIHDRLARLIGNLPADFFADAIDVLELEPAFRSTSHIVGHLLREIESGLRQVLLGLCESRTAKGSDEHRAQITDILRALGLDSDPVALLWMEFAGKESAKGWVRAAHRPDLMPARPVDAYFESNWSEFLQILDAVLGAAESRFDRLIARLKERSTKALPDPADVSFVVRHLGHGAIALDYILEDLPSSWLPALRENGFFMQPPPATFNEADGTLRYPRWSPGRYLARIAPEAPVGAADTIVEIPATDNVLVHSAFLDAAVRMPPEQAARVATREAAWLAQQSRLPFGLSHAVKDLAVHLGKGQAEAAVAVLRATLRLAPPDAGRHGQSALGLQSFEYEELVRDGAAVLSEHAPEAVFSLFCDLLSGADDQNSSWRSTIEDSDQNVFDDPIDHLVVALRDLATRMASPSTVALGQVLEALEARKRPLLTRVGLFLLYGTTDVAPSLVVERATEPRLFETRELFHELGEAIARAFPRLAAGDQEAIIATMRSVASPERLSIRLEDNSSSIDPWLCRYELYQWLAVIAANLPITLRAEFATLQDEFGEREHPTFHAWIGKGEFGPRAPRDAADLAGLDDDRLIAFLQSWQPEDEQRFETSRDRLGHEIRAATERDPVRFARIAPLLRDLHPAYVSNVIWGLENALKTGPTPARAVDWSGILTLLRWTAENTQHDGQTGWVNWRWARRMGADLCETLALYANTLDIDAIREAASILSKLLSDPDPTPTRAASSSLDRSNLAINTVRGQAVHAAVTFADRLLTTPVTQEVFKIATALLREASTRADPTVEPLPVIRAALGNRFNDVLRIDSETAAHIAPTLFGGADASPAQEEAWAEFLHWNGWTRAGFDLLRPQYRRSVERVATLPDRVIDDLANDLAWLAAHGVLNPHTDDNLLATFIARAAPTHRGAALRSLGRALVNTKEPLDVGLAERLQSLWIWWKTQVQELDNTCLMAFGWWFASSGFDDVWVLAELEHVARLHGSVNWEHAVFEKLARLAPGHPNQVASCCRHLLAKPSPERMFAFAKEVKQILATLSAHPETREQGREMAARLLSHGFSQFRDLH